MRQNMLSVFDLQNINENQFNRRHIDKYIRKDLFEADDNGFMEGKLNQGIELVENLINADHFPAKNLRLSQLKGTDIEHLVKEIFVGITYLGNQEMPLVTVIGQLGSRLGFNDRREAYQTMGELLAVLCITDLFDIFKYHPMGSLMVRNNIGLDPRVEEFIERSCYLPPLVCEPRELTHNMSSAYYTHEADSLILGGSVNHHDNDICLDVLNSSNRVPLSLDTEFLSKFEEEPTFDLNTIKQETIDKYVSRGRKIGIAEQAAIIKQQKQQWDHYKKQSYYFYSLIAKQGNKYYTPHKVDKRGRIYAQGYHINYMGTSFKKSMVNFAETEVVNGVPEHLKTK